MPFGTAMGTGDGVQGEVLVQGAEDAVRLSGAGWVAGATGSGPVKRGSPVRGGAVRLASAGDAIGWRPGMKPWSFGIKKTFARMAANGVRSGRRWR
jgi:hypothetical protein